MKHLRIPAIVVCLAAVAVGIVLYRRNTPPAAAPIANPSTVQTPRPAPSEAEAANRLALQAQRAQASGDIDRAISLYREAVAKYAGLPPAWNNLGLLLMEKKDYEGALEAFERAAALSPSDPRPLHNAGVACSRAGWDRKALDYYLAALERDPRDLTALRGAAGSTRKLGLADEASLERLRTAIQVDDNPDWRRVYEREQSRIEAALGDR